MDSELADAHLARLRLKLLRLLYARKLPCTEIDLRMLLDLTVPLLEYIAPDGPVDYVIEHLKDNDLTPSSADLCGTSGNILSSLARLPACNRCGNGFTCVCGWMNGNSSILPDAGVNAFGEIFAT